MKAFNVQGYVKRMANGVSTTYRFGDGSKLTIGKRFHAYKGTDGRVYAMREPFCYATP